MSAIWTPDKIIRKQPQSSVQLASEYSDLAFGFLGSNPIPNIGRAFPNWTQQGGPVESLQNSGVSRASPSYSSNNRYTGPTLNPFVEDWAGLTVVVRMTPEEQVNNFPAVLSWVPVGEFYGGFNLSTESTNGWRNIFIRAGDSALQLTPRSYGVGHSGLHQFTPGTPITIVATWDKATLKLWTADDSGDVLSNSNAHSFGWKNSGSLVAALGYERSGFRTFYHPTEVAYALPRAVTDTQAQTLLDNPYAIFKPKTRTIYFPSAVSGLTLTSITPTTGPATGGTTVTIYGSGFLSGTPEPRFNGVLATDVAVVNDGELTCVTPAL